MGKFLQMGKFINGAGPHDHGFSMAMVMSTMAVTSSQEALSRLLHQKEGNYANDYDQVVESLLWVVRMCVSMMRMLPSMSVRMAVRMTMVMRVMVVMSMFMPMMIVMMVPMPMMIVSTCLHMRKGMEKDITKKSSNCKGDQVLSHSLTLLLSSHEDAIQAIDQEDGND